ncbi:MAG: hypothetical protein GY814_06720 [Gammaproteobacteria bacterium]|nr:hypothetical protein [Gammaproteobacteria bacterium]
MAQVERYRIVLTGWVISGFKTQDVVADLCSLFRMPEDGVRELLMGEPSIIRRDLLLERAERLRNKIERRGAVCNLQLVLRDATADYQSEIEIEGVFGSNLNIEKTEFIPVEQSSQFVAPQLVASESKREESEPSSRSLVVVAVLISVLILAAAWGYLGLPKNKHSPSPIPKIYTLAPAKGQITGGESVESVQ